MSDDSKNTLELTEEERFARGGMAEIIDRLIEKGYIERTQRDELYSKLDESIRTYFANLHFQIGRQLRTVTSPEAIFTSAAGSLLRLAKEDSLPETIQDVYAFFHTMLFRRLCRHARDARLPLASESDDETGASSKRRVGTWYESDFLKTSSGESTTLDAAVEEGLAKSMVAKLSTLLDMSPIELKLQAEQISERVARLPDLNRGIIQCKVEGKSEKEVADEVWADYVALYPNAKSEGAVERPTWVRKIYQETIRAIYLSTGLCPDCGEFISSQNEEIPRKCTYKPCYERYRNKVLKKAERLEGQNAAGEKAGSQQCRMDERRLAALMQEQT